MRIDVGLGAMNCANIGDDDFYAFHGLRSGAKSLFISSLWKCI
jgi:hypothetical protein